MTAGDCCRTVRAAMFAALCVLLTAFGHALMSGAPVPWWALGCATVATGGTAWCLAGRERGFGQVVAVAVATQAVLHELFSVAQEAAGPSMASMSMPMGHSGMPMTMPMDMSPGRHAEAMGHMGSMGHDMAGMSSTGMFAAHLLAALLCGLWLAYGERAAFRILRAFAGWIFAPLRMALLRAVPPSRPRPRARRDRTARVPRRLFLVHAITSRGPPVGTAVV
ncbi:hypothetical protein [Streptomyces sp. CBMA152]|uniref:hypothetical protein n=1 Tax=Streptomyces sp. CBMA152 TaxID=1896312 RepID=UPI001660EDDB|nr:hypothetical protein [Streptomyces sp. CBMA152]MBD0745044.1 hypothetical protein [Streptomyces sp. CBMA152]